MSCIGLGRYRWAGRCVLIFSLFVIGTTVSARAEAPASEAALKQRLRVLEARLQYLEEKLTKIERSSAIEAAEKSKPGTKPKTDKSKGDTAVSTTAPESDKKPAAGQQPSAGSKDKENLTPAEQAAAATKEKDTAAQETFVLRDQSPTLKKGKVEASLEFNYMNSNGFLQADRVWSVNPTVRYGLMNGLELSASLPYYNSVRTTATGPSSNYLGSVNGVGSATLGLSYSLLDQTPDMPGVAVSLSGIYPGSVSPYDFSHYQPSTNPVDILKSVQGSGHWGIGANAVAYKIVDPLLVFAGGGFSYLLPKNYFGYSVEPSIRYTGNMGFSFALSEKTTLAFQVIGFYQPDLRIDNIPIPQSFQEQYLGRFVVTQRIFDDTWVEPNIAFGLTKNSPDVNIGTVVRKRW